MRCKACNIVLAASEIIWRSDIKEHEPLCRRCRLNYDDISITYEEDMITEEDWMKEHEWD